MSLSILCSRAHRPDGVAEYVACSFSMRLASAVEEFGLQGMKYTLLRRATGGQHVGMASGNGRGSLIALPTRSLACLRSRKVQGLGCRCHARCLLVNQCGQGDSLVKGEARKCGVFPFKQCATRLIFRKDETPASSSYQSD